MEEKYIVLTHEMIRRTDMTMQEKIIFTEILNLSSLDKGCIASNKHFEVSFGISKKSVSNTISSLIKKGFIESKLSDRNMTRILSIKNGHYPQKMDRVSTKNGESKENNTINNTDKGADEVYEAYKLNIKASRKRQNSLNNIAKWIKDGYTKEQLITAILNYKKIADTQEEKYKKECANFFGVKDESKGFFKDYISDESTKEIEEKVKRDSNDRFEEVSF